ncbi:hypothetical protein [Alkaliphilus sp. B6464]|uniref:hypothetical protein n=1 Tax=Alkaliphilus sp. B6464 TaxID=2731219 RepID=UPI001BA45AD6|nr:hypothetical protein [Alkaliphilus sp. B6464]QUH21451.1 hypothetical protein HYG84_17215 [Alkaliphilus sp. B6464]
MATTTTDKIKRNLKDYVIILDDLDLTWTTEQIQQAIFMWTCGWSIEEMARKLRKYDGIRNAVDEVALLIMHLGRQNKIESREGGIFGHGQARGEENHQSGGRSSKNIF